MLGLPKTPVRRRAERKPFISATPSANSRHPAGWRGKGFLRLLLLMVSAALVAAVAANFGIARDYGYLRASVLTGTAGGYYHTLATRLADRAKRGHGTLSVIPTAGSIENVSRLTSGQGRCTEMFALIQDGTPVSADARLELLGRLPEPEISPVARKTGQRLSHIRGFARRIDRRRSARLRHGLPHAATLSRTPICGSWISSCHITSCLSRLGWWLRASSTLPPS